MQEEITKKLLDVLNTTFQLDEFRPGQLDALLLLMQQGRLLCIQPTGYGKSLLYQIPSVILGGITLVISPLLALMRDQLLQLKNRFGIAAASINTDQSEQENSAAKRAAQAGTIRILFIAPEQLDHVDRFRFLLELPISLLVVDEAHCISTWGHDFRPSYRQIISLARDLVNKNPGTKLLGLTATANEKTEADIKQQLTVDRQKVVVHRENMDRPNIRLTVIQTVGIATKFSILNQLMRNLQGSGLIYCATRENTELVAEYLNNQGIQIIAYHAGIETQLKRCIQNDFIKDKYPVIVATNALGMGIDKPNLRFVIHFDFPGSTTAYYQEVGRAGRDGNPAEGILLYDPGDSKIQKYFIEAAQPTAIDFKKVIHTITAAPIPPNLSTLKRETGLHPTKLTVVTAELVEQEFVKKISVRGTQTYQMTDKSGTPDLTRYQNQYQVRTIELETMQAYAEQTKKCLMMTLRSALGDKKAKACGSCSNCKKIPFKLIENKDMIITVSSWLNRRSVPITLNKKIKRTAAGIAVLDGKLRSIDFIQFMRERADAKAPQLGISDNLQQLIKDCLNDLASCHKLVCIVPIPSRTWMVRDQVINFLAKLLKIPVRHDLLFWQATPSSRQGELLNNDQRQHNVALRMVTRHDQKVPKGTILLFDDYIGSGATMNEAARSLREHGRIENVIVPFTLAAVKWRLGKKGML